MSIQSNSSDEDSSPEFLGIVPPTATLFAPNDLAVHPNSVDEDSSPEFLGIVPPTATLFTPNDLAVHPNSVDEDSSPEFLGIVPPTATLFAPNDLIPGNTYKVVYDEEMDEGTLLVFHERILVDQSYRLTRENYCLDEDEEYEPKYNYIFQRKGGKGDEGGVGERVPIAEVFLHYGLVKFYLVSTK